MSSGWPIVLKARSPKLGQRDGMFMTLHVKDRRAAMSAIIVAAIFEQGVHPEDDGAVVLVIRSPKAAGCNKIPRHPRERHVISVVGMARFLRNGRKG
jgi:hypothetical protein